MKNKQLIAAVLTAFAFSAAHTQPESRRIEARAKQSAESASAPEIVFNVGHSGTVEAVCYSPDGKYIASGAADATIKIWEVETGRCVRTLEGHTRAVYSVSYSPDGKYLASGSGDCAIKIWNAATGDCIQTFKGHTRAVTAVVYSPDGKYLASASEDNTIKIWEIGSEDYIKSFKEHTNSVTSVCYSPDGKYIASASEDNTIKIWEIENGTCINTFNQQMNQLNIVTYSPDGKYLAGGADDNTIKIWEIESGTCIKTLIGHKNYIAPIVYSPDGRYLASGSDDNEIKIWEIKNGKCIKTLKGHTRYVRALFYSPDGKYLASGAGDNTIKMWEVKKGICRKTFGADVYGVNNVCCSPDGNYLLSSHLGNSTLDSRVKVFDLRTSEYARIFDTKVTVPCLDDPLYQYMYKMGAASIDCSTDSKSVAIGGVTTVSIWKIRSGKYIWAQDKHEEAYNEEGYIENKVEDVAYSPDGKYLASGSGDKTIKIWKVKSGECIKTFYGHQDKVKSICYSPDGKYLASGSWDRTIKIWKASSGECIKTFENDNNDAINSICYSPDGKYLASGSGNSNGHSAVDIWEVDTGKCIRSHESYDIRNILSNTIIRSDSRRYVHNEAQTNWINSVRYSSDGRYIAAGTSYGAIKIIDVVEDSCVETLEDHKDEVYSVSFSPDGSYIVSGSNDGTIKFWDISTGALLATTFNLQDEEWFTYTPEGFFAGSEWAINNLVHIRLDGMKTVGIDQMFDSLYRPDLVFAKLHGKDISSYAQKTNFETILQSGSAPITAFLNLEEDITNRDVTIEYSIQNTGGGIGEVNLLLNGKNIRLADGVPSTNGQTLYFSHTVTLQDGENTLELFAKNEAGQLESLRASKILTWHGNVRKPNLYVFTVAVNKYRDGSLRLKYAVPDAKSIAKGFASQTKLLYQNIFTFNLFDDDVTKDGLYSSFQEVSKKVEADDVFVFYIAGHGFANEEDGDYYFLPSDFRFTGLDAIVQNGISKNDLIRYLSLIKAGKTLVLMDTCHSGSFLDDNARGLTEKTAINRLSRATGHATIVASSKTQSAMEGYNGHGIFTYTVVEGLSGKADADNDGFITLQELSAYTETEVPRRSYEKWGYEQIPQRDLRRQDFPIYTRKE